MKIINAPRFKRYFILIVLTILLISIIGFVFVEVVMQKACYAGIVNENLCPADLLGVVYDKTDLFRQFGLVVGVRTYYFPGFIFEIYYILICSLLIGYAHKNKYFSKRLIIACLLLYFAYTPLRNTIFDEVSNLEKSIVKYDCPNEKMQILNHEMFISRESSVCKTHFYSGSRNNIR